MSNSEQASARSSRPARAGEPVVPTISLPEKMLDLGRQGPNRTVILMGKRVVHVGPLTLVEEPGSSRRETVKVAASRVLPFSKLPNAVVEFWGAASHQAVVDSLLPYYPEMTVDSEVTVILCEALGELAWVATARSSNLPANDAS